MKNFIKYIFYLLLSLIIILVCFVLLSGFIRNYNYNHKYSIAMPTILGRFDANEKAIQIYGLKNIVNDNIATLAYSEFFCVPSLKYCSENGISISGWGDDIIMVPISEKYEIKYADKNKIIVSDGLKTTGEIDLNLKTIYFTIKNAGIDGNETRKIEIITDNNEIKKLEKKIIRKHLKIKMFN